MIAPSQFAPDAGHACSAMISIPRAHPPRRVSGFQERQSSGHVGQVVSGLIRRGERGGKPLRRVSGFQERQSSGHVVRVVSFFKTISLHQKVPRGFVAVKISPQPTPHGMCLVSSFFSFSFLHLCFLLLLLFIVCNCALVISGMCLHVTQ